MAQRSILFTNNTPVAANTQHTFTYNALLNLDSLQPIAGATLNFFFGDGTSASGTTGSNGIATVTHQCAPCAAPAAQPRGLYGSWAAPRALACFTCCALSAQCCPPGTLRARHPGQS